jgi:hypothetical protein
MTVHVGAYEFDHVAYDSDGDVLYLRRGGRQAAADPAPWRMKPSLNSKKQNAIHRPTIPHRRPAGPRAVM